MFGNTKFYTKKMFGNINFGTFQRLPSLNHADVDKAFPRWELSVSRNVSGS